MQGFKSLVGLCALTVFLAGCGGGGGTGPEGKEVELRVITANVTQILQQGTRADVTTPTYTATSWINANLEVGDVLLDGGQRLRVEGIEVQHWSYGGGWMAHLTEGDRSGPAMKLTFYDFAGGRTLDLYIWTD